MRQLLRAAILVAAILSTACSAPTSSDATAAVPEPVPAMSSGQQTPRGEEKTTESAAPAPSNATPVLHLPERFSSYAVQVVEGGNVCVVGKETDEDGMDAKPSVYVVDEKSGDVRWNRQLDVPADTFQSRATHCAQSGSSLYVLLQSDTQPQQTLSQTLLRVVKIAAGDGAPQADQAIAVPGVLAAYSAWVAEGAEHFKWQDDALVIAGEYALMSDKEQRKPFSVRLGQNLTN